MKEIKDANKWKDIICSWIRIINIVKTASLPTAIYRFSGKPYNNPKDIFYRNRTKNS